MKEAIPPYYDSLIAKLIVAGNDRDKAIFALGARARDVYRARNLYHDPTTEEFWQVQSFEQGRWIRGLLRGFWRRGHDLMMQRDSSLTIGEPRT